MLILINPLDTGNHHHTIDITSEKTKCYGISLKVAENFCKT